MVNPLHIILPFLRARRGAQEKVIDKHPMGKAYEFTAVLRTFCEIPQSGLEQQIYDLAVRLSQATTLSTEEAVGYVTGCIRDGVNQGMAGDEAVRNAFDAIEKRYLSRPLSVFDKRHEVHSGDGDE